MNGHPVSWRVQILRHIDDPAADDLYKRYKFDEPWDGPNNLQLLPLMPKVYAHPADPSTVPTGHTHYRVFATPPDNGPSAVFTRGTRGPTAFAITDGMSNTILIVEAAVAVPWTLPEALPYSPDQPLPKLGGLFTGGANAAFADGSIRFLRDTLPESTLRALITRDGGEVVSDY